MTTWRCLLLHQCFCLQWRGSDSLMQMLIASLLFMHCASMSSFCSVVVFEKFGPDLQFFQLKKPESRFQLRHRTAQGQSDLNSQFMPQVSQPFKVGSVQCLFRTCLVLLGRTRRVRYQHNGESSAILYLALLLSGIFLLPFKTKHEDCFLPVWGLVCSVSAQTGTCMGYY